VWFYAEPCKLPCRMILCRTMQSLKTFAKRQEKQASNRARWAYLVSCGSHAILGVVKLPEVKQGFYFSNFWGRQTCDAPEEDGAKFGYRSESKVQILWTWYTPKEDRGGAKFGNRSESKVEFYGTLLYFWRHLWSYGLNMANWPFLMTLCHFTLPPQKPL